MDLATGLSIPSDEVEKEYDYVYFARDINKAADFAIEAFAIALKSFPNLTLDIIGSYDGAFKSQLESRIQELGIGNRISFEGSYPSHEDVVKQVRKARIALLPFKIDNSPTTIPEAMSLGLPVVSTCTDGIQLLYKDGYNILLSEIGNHQALADNMCKLLNDSLLFEKIKENALALIRSDDNTARMKTWLEIYKSIAKKS